MPVLKYIILSLQVCQLPTHLKYYNAVLLNKKSIIKEVVVNPETGKSSRVTIAQIEV